MLSAKHFSLSELAPWQLQCVSLQAHSLTHPNMSCPLGSLLLRETVFYHSSFAKVSPMQTASLWENPVSQFQVHSLSSRLLNLRGTAKPQPCCQSSATGRGRNQGFTVCPQRWLLHRVWGAGSSWLHTCFVLLLKICCAMRKIFPTDILIFLLFSGSCLPARCPFHYLNSLPHPAHLPQPFAA